MITDEKAKATVKGDAGRHAMGYLMAARRMKPEDGRQRLGNSADVADVDIVGYGGDDACVWIEAIGEHHSAHAARQRAYELLVAADYADGKLHPEGGADTNRGAARLDERFAEAVWGHLPGLVGCDSEVEELEVVRAAVNAAALDDTNREDETDG